MQLIKSYFIIDDHIITKNDLIIFKPIKWDSFIV